MPDEHVDLRSVNWTQGMFLTPDHFLRQERYVDSLVLWLMRFGLDAAGLVGGGPRVEPSERGAARFDPIVDIDDSGDTLKVSVTQCRGITRSGVIVDVDPSRPLQATFSKKELEGVLDVGVYVVARPHEKEAGRQRRGSGQPADGARPAPALRHPARRARRRSAGQPAARAPAPGREGTAVRARARVHPAVRVHVRAQRADARVPAVERAGGRDCRSLRRAASRDRRLRRLARIARAQRRTGQRDAGVRQPDGDDARGVRLRAARSAADADALLPADDAADSQRGAVPVARARRRASTSACSARLAKSSSCRCSSRRAKRSGCRAAGPCTRT